VETASSKNRPARRDFCVRVDGAAWKKQSWAAFRAEGEFITKYTEHADEIARIAKLLQDHGVILYQDYENASLPVRSSLRACQSQHSNVQSSEADRLKAKISLLAALEHQARKGPFDGLDAVRKRAAAMINGYHRERLLHAEFGVIGVRERLCNELKQLQGVRDFSMTDSAP
jgi:hypothetical protein